jgi:hypothetical protein
MRIVCNYIYDPKTSTLDYRMRAFSRTATIPAHLTLIN